MTDTIYLNGEPLRRTYPIPGCSTVVGLNGTDSHCGSPLADLCDDCRPAPKTADLTSLDQAVAE